MPRFSDLDRQVTTLLKDGKDPLTSNDPRVKAYWEWKLNQGGDKRKQRPESIRSNDRDLKNVAILPFSLTLPANFFFKATISKRAKAITGAGSVYGYQTLSGSDIALQVDSRDFTPAKVYFRNAAADASVTRPASRITKQPYKSRFAATDEGYQAPFGKVGTDNYNARVTALNTTLESYELRSFKNEKYSPTFDA